MNKGFQAASSTQFKPVGSCIYCGNKDSLSDEHIIPFGIDGHLVLPKASCQPCSVITGQFEQRLLRGHWWPLRRILKLKSRREREQRNSFKALLKTSNNAVSIQIQADEYPGFIHFELSPPSILEGIVTENSPMATGMLFKCYSNAAINRFQPQKNLWTPENQQITFPINFEVDDLVRFLAKVGLSYAIAVRGLDAFENIFIREIIKGETKGANTYIGGANSSFLDSILPPKKELHALVDRRQGQNLSIYIQLFRDGGDPPPIYEVVVGKLKSE